MDQAPKISLVSRRAPAAPLPQSKSLLSYLAYTPAERNQGSCGDCWQWASTGALEIDHAVKNSVKDRLSVQYFNSNYFNGAAGYACCGGWLNYFTDWYNDDPAHRTPLPWSNTNASFGDRNTGCGSATAVPAGTISTSPHYLLDNITYSLLATDTVGQSAAVMTIKTQINANKPVWYAFFCNSTGLSDFQNFWAFENEDRIYNPDPWANFSYNGSSYGHAVLIVGYNETDPDPDNAYWLVLNSWGAPSNRPNGLFRLKMYMNYDAMYQSSNLHWYPQQVFQILDANFNASVVPWFPSAMVGVFRNGTRQFILKNGTERTVVSWGLSTDTPVAGDWNGDGRDDVGVYRPSIQKFILKNGTERTVVLWGLSTDIPVTGDWNGDGMGDVGVYRPDIQKFILKNGTERTVVLWGNDTDIPVTGDWNGDGMGDVGVYRPDIQKFILKNGTERTVVQWGLGTDIPVTGDWNGDGLGDVGVFRPSIAKFILKNGTERTVIPWGLGTDIPVAGSWS